MYNYECAHIMFMYVCEMYVTHKIDSVKMIYVFISPYFAVNTYKQDRL